MKAMLLRQIAPVHEGSLPLELAEIADPRPKPGELLIRVTACGVCHTELDEIEGRTPPAFLPIDFGTPGRRQGAGEPRRAALPAWRAGGGRMDFLGLR